MSDGAPRRIHVIGDQGAGKTTLASRLGVLLGAPVTHLDEVVLDPATGRQRTPDELLVIAQDLAAAPAWVTEGLHADWTRPLFDHADRVVWLDTVGRARAAWRVTGRFVRGAWAESRRRGWRGLFRFREYAGHLADLLRTTGRVASSGRSALRDADGRARSDGLATALARDPGRLVRCRSTADVEAFIATLPGGSDAQPAGRS